MRIYIPSPRVISPRISPPRLVHAVTHPVRVHSSARGPGRRWKMIAALAAADSCAPRSEPGSAQDGMCGGSA